MASAAAHPMHGQWSWQSTPAGPRAAPGDSSPTYAFTEKASVRALTVRLRSGGPRIHSRRHGALGIFDEKKKILRSSCRATNAHKIPRRNKRFGANPQGDGNRSRDTELHSQRNTLKNLRTKYEFFSAFTPGKSEKEVMSEEQQSSELRVLVTQTGSESNCF